jgi:hypothetical protein
MVPKNFFYKHRFRILFCFLLLLNCVDRWRLMDQFTFRYVDDDQSIMWYGAKEFGEGNFREPFFFGQNYNTMVESLFAVPLIKAGVSYPVALTTIMSFFTFLPYLIIALLLFKRKKEITALAALSVPLLLSPQFGMATAISRGCATGIFFGSFAFIALFTQHKWRFLVFGFFSVLGLFGSQNAAVILFPAGVWLLIENYRDKKFYLQNFIGAVPAAMIWFFAQRFYQLHPEYIVHPAWNLDYDLGRIRPAVWNSVFGYVIPVFWNLALLLFPMLIALCVMLFRQQEKAAAWGLAAGIAFIFFSLGINKIHDGYDTVFYSSARMFIAIPLLFALFISKLNISKIRPVVFQLLLLVPLCVFVVKFIIAPAAVHREVGEKTEHNMYVEDISVLRARCAAIRSIAEKNNVTLVVAGKHFTKHLVAYGCPCLEEKLPPVIEPELDRRTWLLKEEEDKVKENVLFISFTGDNLTARMKNYPGLLRLSADPLVLMLKDNKLKTGALLDSLGIPMRKH